MAVRSVLILGLLGLAGLSLSASLAIVAVAPGAGETGESARQGPPPAPVNACDHKVPCFDAIERMPPSFAGSWEALFWAGSR